MRTAGIGCGVCTTKCEFDAIHLYRGAPECSTMRVEDKLKYILPYGTLASSGPPKGGRAMHELAYFG